MARLRFVDDDVTPAQKLQDDVTTEQTQDDVTETEAVVKRATVVDGMWSKDGEYVDLCRQCHLTGQVGVA